MAALRSWRENIIADREFPYVRQFVSGEKQLLYFGSKHCYEPTDKMFENITGAFGAINPEVVLVEGNSELSRAKSGENRAAILRKFIEPPEAEIVKSWGESGFAARLAAQRGIAVYSPEPEPHKEILDLLKLGFSRDHIFLHYLLRDIDQFHRMQAGDFVSYFESCLPWFKESSRWADFDYSLRHLQSVAEEVWLSGVNFLDFEFVKEKTWPTKWETVINEISRASSDFRDNFIVSELVHHLTEVDRVFVVYGGSHLVRQELVLEVMFTELNRSSFL